MLGGGHPAVRRRASTCSAIGASTPVRLGEGEQRGARLGALGDLAGRGVDLLGRHALAELLAEGAVARQRRGAGGDQVAEAGQPHQGQRVGAQRGREPRGLGQPAGDDRGGRVVAEPEPDGHADRERRRRSCRRRRARSRARRRWCRAGTPARGRAPAAAWRRPRRAQATTEAAGSRRAISWARLGPLTTAIRSGPAPVTSAITSLIRFSVPSSTPFISDTSVASGGSTGAHSARFSRSVCDGTASTTTSAPAAASSGSWVAWIAGGSSMPGR